MSFGHEYMWCDDFEAGNCRTGDGLYIDENGDAYIEHDEDRYEFDDDEDAFVNSKDPLLRHRHASLYEAHPGQTIAVMCAILDSERVQRNSALTGRTEDPDADAEDDAAIEYISLHEHLSSGARTTAPGIEKRPLQPFEQWVDDVLSGKKTYDDPL